MTIMTNDYNDWTEVNLVYRLKHIKMSLFKDKGNLDFGLMKVRFLINETQTLGY